MGGSARSCHGGGAREAHIDVLTSWTEPSWGTPFLLIKITSGGESAHYLNEPSQGGLLSNPKEWSTTIAWWRNRRWRGAYLFLVPGHTDNNSPPYRRCRACADGQQSSVFVWMQGRKASLSTAPKLSRLTCGHAEGWILDVAFCTSSLPCILRWMSNATIIWALFRCTV